MALRPSIRFKPMATPAVNRKCHIPIETLKQGTSPLLCRSMATAMFLSSLLYLVIKNNLVSQIYEGVAYPERYPCTALMKHILH